MKVKQFYNKNQFIIEGQIAATKEIYFQSYNTTIAKIIENIGCNKVLYVSDYWDYSKTTSKHFYLFLQDYLNINLISNNKRKEFQKILNSGKYEKGIISITIIKKEL